MKICFFNLFYISLQKMKVGDIVEYVDDWKKGRKWYLYSISKKGLCTIVILRGRKITNEKNGEERLNASIVNLGIEKIRLIK